MEYSEKNTEMQSDNPINTVSIEVEEAPSDAHTSFFKRIWFLLRPAVTHVAKLSGFNLLFVGVICILLAIVTALPMIVMKNGNYHVNPIVSLLFWRLFMQTAVLCTTQFGYSICFGKRVERACRYAVFVPFIVIMNGFLLISTLVPYGKTTIYAELYGKIVVFTILVLFFIASAARVYIVQKRESRIKSDLSVTPKQFYNPFLYLCVPLILGLSFFYGFSTILLPAFRRSSLAIQFVYRLILFPTLMEFVLIASRFVLQKQEHKEFSGAPLFFFLPQMGLLGRVMMISESGLTVTIIMSFAVSLLEIALRTTRIERETTILRGIVGVMPKRFTYWRESLRLRKNRQKEVSSEGEYIQYWGYIRGEIGNIEMITELYGAIVTSVILPLFLKLNNVFICFAFSNVDIPIDTLVIGLSIQLILEYIVDVLCVYYEEKHFIPLRTAWKRRKPLHLLFEFLTISMATFFAIVTTDRCPLLV